MNVLVACHCKQDHEPILYIPIQKGVPTGGRPIDDVFPTSYIDIDCTAGSGQYTSWTAVPRATFNVIFTYNCPLYLMLTDGHWGRQGGETRILLDNLLNEGWLALKPGGAILIPIERTIAGVVMEGNRRVYKLLDHALETQLANLRGALSQVSKKRWTADILFPEDLDFVLGTEREIRTFGSYAFLVIRKPKRRRQTRKR